MRRIVASVAFVAAMLAAGSPLAQPETGQASPAASSGEKKPETVVVTPAEGMKIFDMRQCRADGTHCEMATCASTPTQEGRLIICQSHGTFFP